MNRYTKWAAILSTSAFVAASAWADETVKLSADAAVALAVKQNPQSQAHQLDTQAGLAGVSEAEAQFGRTMSLQATHTDDREPSISSLDQVPTASSNTQQFALALNQRLSTGGAIGFTFTQNRTSNNAGYYTINPVFNAGFDMKFTQPLLRGRGAINKTDIRLAQYALDGAKLNAADYRRTLEADVRSAYWDLVMARDQYAVARQLRDGAQRVLETTRARVDAGAAAPNAILQARLGVAQRESDIIVAEDGIRDAEDRLKTFMGFDGRADLRLVPTDTLALAPFTDDLNAGLERAQANNPAYRQTAVAVESGEARAAWAKDQTHPDITLTLHAGLSGIGAQYSDNLKGLGNADGRSWQGGLSFNVPLGANAARAQYQQRLLELEQTRLNREYQRMQLTASVQERYRQVQTDRRRTEVARLAEQLAEQNLAEEEARLKLGLSTVRNVLDAQDDLAKARANRLGAEVDFQKSRIEWHRLTDE